MREIVDKKGMRYVVSEVNIPTVTIENMPEGAKIYAETQSAVDLSSICDDENQGGIVRSSSMDYEVPKRSTTFGKLFAMFETDVKQTIAREVAGEPVYIQYTAKEPNQEATFRACFPGSIMVWNAAPLEEGEVYLKQGETPKSIYSSNPEDRPHGTLIAVNGSFLVADIAVKTEVYHQKTDKDVDLLVKTFSKTDNNFQKFSGDGYVCLEVAGGEYRQKPLYPGQTHYVFPGSLVAFTEGISLEIKSAGDIGVRTMDKRDYIIRCTAPPEGGYIYIRSASIEDFFEMHKKMYEKIFKKIMDEKEKS